jgi:hypothetical protein
MAVAGVSMPSDVIPEPAYMVIFGDFLSIGFSSEPKAVRT